MNDRASRIWLWGDSIFTGSALGRKLRLFSEAEAAAEPMWPIRSPATTMNLLWGDDLVERGGQTGMPDEVDLRSSELRAAIFSGQIQPGDSIVFLDVGHHCCNPARHEALWDRLRRAAIDQVPVNLFMCTGFDNVDRSRPPFSSQPAEPLMHDLLFGDRSHNDAIRAAATVEVGGPGTTTLVEIGAAISELHRDLVAVGATAYRPDNIHLNLLGQTGLSIMLCRAISTRPIQLTKVFSLLQRDPLAAGTLPILERLAGSVVAAAG